MVLDYNSESRLRAIALNAVREAALVYGRFDKQFTDDDAARIENIYHILHLSDIGTSYEHAALIADPKASVTAAALQISDLLANLPVDAAPSNTIVEDSPVKAALPKASTKVTAAN